MNSFTNTQDSTSIPDITDIQKNPETLNTSKELNTEQEYNNESSKNQSTYYIFIFILFSIIVLLSMKIHSLIKQQTKQNKTITHSKIELIKKQLTEKEEKILQSYKENLKLKDIVTAYELQVEELKTSISNEQNNIKKQEEQAIQLTSRFAALNQEKKDAENKLQEQIINMQDEIINTKKEKEQLEMLHKALIETTKRDISTYSVIKMEQESEINDLLEKYGNLKREYENLKKKRSPSNLNNLDNSFNSNKLNKSSNKKSIASLTDLDEHE